MTKARVVKVRHNLLHIVLEVNQSKTLSLIFVTAIHATAGRPHVVRGAMHSGK